MKKIIPEYWEIMLLELYKMGGGPLPRSKFDWALETEYAATTGTGRLLLLEMATRDGINKFARWTITDKGRDWCEGRIIIVNGKVRRIAETEEETSRRHAIVIAGSDDAAASCFRLSEKQREALVLLAKGFTFIEVGDMLKIADSSVAYRISEAFKILGCTRTTEAVVLATKAGLV